MTPLTKKWSSIYEHRCKHHGKAFAVKFMKNLNTTAERFALRQKIEPIPWTRSNKEGYPRILGKVFKTFLRSEDSRKVIMALSVTRTCEMLMLPISKDIDSVILPSKADDSTIKPILDFIPTWVRRIRKSSDLGEIRYHFTAKNGPNGPALKASDSDILAIMNDPPLLEAIRVVEGKLNDPKPMPEIDPAIIRKANPVHSKLNQFPDKAGKTRTIAIIDYYSQRCLKPLHEYVMKLLASLVSDGTYSHQNVGKYAQKVTLEKGYIYCADLTAATDRFPREIQRVLLNELLEDNELSQALWTLLAERTFKLAWSDEKVRYECGQPMGAYASWPIFALAHHLIVEYSAEIAGTKDIKSKYRLIGDDVIITDRGTAEVYQRVITALGVEINLGKTVESTENSEFSGAEVAKQLYLNGVCLTPITPGFIQDIRKPYMFNTCLRILIDRYEFIGPDFPSMLIDLVFDKRRKSYPLVWLLASNPICGVIKPDYSGYNDNSQWADKDMDYFYREFPILLIDKFMDKSMKNAQLAMRAMFSGGPWKDPTQPKPKCYMYVVQDISRTLREFGQVLDELMADPDNLEEVLKRLDYIPDPYLPYQSRKELRQKRLSSIIEWAYCRLFIGTENLRQ